MHACMHVYTFGLRISIGLNSEQIFHFSEVERVKKEGKGGGIEGGWEENREKKKTKGPRAYSTLDRVRLPSERFSLTELGWGRLGWVGVVGWSAFICALVGSPRKKARFFLGSF